MNYIPDNASSQGMSIDELVKLNGQALEEINRMPYQPILYALPGDWLKADYALRQQAADFQPELYRLIGQRMTRQEFRQMQDQQLQTIRTELQDQMRSIRSTLQQDGSVREQNFSRTSELLCDNRKDMRQLVERLENSLKRILIFTAVGSMALSVLVCMVLQH